MDISIDKRYGKKKGFRVQTSKAQLAQAQHEWVKVSLKGPLFFFFTHFFRFFAKFLWIIVRLNEKNRKNKKL